VKGAGPGCWAQSWEELGRRRKIKGEKNGLPKPFGLKTKLKNKWATEFFFNFSTKT
jgi:hypothetical protein